MYTPTTGACLVSYLSETGTHSSAYRKVILGRNIVLSMKTIASFMFALINFWNEGVFQSITPQACDPKSQADATNYCLHLFPAPILLTTNSQVNEQNPNMVLKIVPHVVNIQVEEIW